MAQRVKSSLKRSSRRGPSLDPRDDQRELNIEPSSRYKQIELVARRDARLDFGEKKTRVFLTNWWCTHYNRPIKDPLLQQYTLEELVYEYYLVNEVVAYREELAKAEDDKIEEAKMQAAEEWADQMEAEEEAERLAEEERKNKKAEEKQLKDQAEEPYDPLKDPKQIEWMEEEMKKSKLMFGDDFGEDLNLDFKSED